MVMRPMHHESSSAPGGTRAGACPDGAAVLMAAGCSAVFPAGNPVAPATYLPCARGAAGADIEVQVTGSMQSCDQWVQDLAPIGLNWHLITRIATILPRKRRQGPRRC